MLIYAQPKHLNIKLNFCGLSGAFTLLKKYSLFVNKVDRSHSIICSVGMTQFQIQHVVFINCGATVDLVELLQPPENMVFYICDRWVLVLAKCVGNPCII